MGYAVYEDRAAADLDVARWAGYGVPAVCDMPDCETKINRGMGYRCEHVYKEAFFRKGERVDIEDDWDEERVEEHPGCELHFCEEHLYDHDKHEGVEPKPDTDEWVAWMLTDPSWGQWRRENKIDRNTLYQQLAAKGMTLRDVKTLAVEADS
jgi:hypothetical protein